MRRPLPYSVLAAMNGGQGMDAEITPLLKKPRAALFSPGHRMRMNIVPMFLNIFIPWGIFVYCFGLSSFYLMYAAPLIAWICISVIFIFWIFFVIVAFCARRYDPDPTWFTFFSILALICVIWGIVSGLANLHKYEAPYFTLLEMSVATGVNGTGVNPSVISGEDVMDAGLITFQAGSSFDATKAWHFMKGTLYCVAPILGPGVSVPMRQTYDFWAIGKDCCSITASDFRCGSWGSTQAHTGLREINEADLEFYRLAVKQAESLYDIMAPHPIFLKWTEGGSSSLSSLSSRGFFGSGGLAAHQDALPPEVKALHIKGFSNFIVFSGSNLLFCIFAVTLASARFAFLGRSRSPYDEVLGEAP